MAMMHDVKLSPQVVERVKQRRGGALHAYDRLDALKTALLVIDMQNVWVQEGQPAYSPYCQGIVPNINRLAGAVRHAGGPVYWIRAIYGGKASEDWSAYLDFFSPAHMEAMTGALTEGAEGARLWRGMDVLPIDEQVIKSRFSAFIQGSSDIEGRLRARGIDTLLITGTATNVCCESSARDAFMLNFKTIMVSDANATGTDEAHNATLNALFGRFSDVYRTDEVVALLEAGRGAAAAE